MDNADLWLSVSFRKAYRVGFTKFSKLKKGIYSNILKKKILVRCSSVFCLFFTLIHTATQGRRLRGMLQLLALVQVWCNSSINQCLTARSYFIVFHTLKMPSFWKLPWMYCKFFCSSNILCGLITITVTIQGCVVM